MNHSEEKDLDPVHDLETRFRVHVEEQVKSEITKTLNVVQEGVIEPKQSHLPPVVFKYILVTLGITFVLVGIVLGVLIGPRLTNSFTPTIAPTSQNVTFSPTAIRPTTQPSEGPSTNSFYEDTLIGYLYALLVPVSGSKLWDKSSMHYQSLQYLSELLIEQNISLVEANYTDIYVQLYVVILMTFSLGITEEEFSSDLFLCGWNNYTTELGFFCDDSDIWEVTRISFPSHMLNGRIVSELAYLSHLKILDLSNNYLDGTLPSTIGELTDLKQLLLQNNTMIGTVPTEIGRLGNLEILNLSHNEMHDLLPLQLSHLINLERLELQGNNFDGAIPSGILTLPNLKACSLHDNDLTGYATSDFCPAVFLLEELTTDCIDNNRTKCSCCTACWDGDILFDTRP